MRIFINQQPCDATPGHDVYTAIRECDPSLSEKIAAGEAYATDARGVRLAGTEALEAGSILRVVTSARKNDPLSDVDT